MTVKPFLDALRGICVLFRTQWNARVHLVIFAFALVGGLVFKISLLEWCAVLLAAGLVIGAEALNTAIEFLADAVHPDQHPLVGKAKDLGAAGVLMAAIAAAAVGLIIFLPKLIVWIPPT